MAPRKVEITVDAKGRIRAEFYCFPGEECFEEAENLRKMLAGMGVQVSAIDVVKKSEADIAREIGADVEEEMRQKVRTQG